jgi:hypothetical protein
MFLALAFISPFCPTVKTVFKTQIADYETDWVFPPVS